MFFSMIQIDEIECYSGGVEDMPPFVFDIYD